MTLIIKAPTRIGWMARVAPQIFCYLGLEALHGCGWVSRGGEGKTDNCKQATSGIGEASGMGLAPLTKTETGEHNERPPALSPIYRCERVCWSVRRNDKTNKDHQSY